MFKVILSACRRREAIPSPALRRGVAILLLTGLAGPALSATRTPTADAAAVVGAFDEICMGTGFSPEAVEGAFTRHGWKGVLVQRPSEPNSASAWSFDFGEIRVGHSMMGIDLTSFSCDLTVKAEAAPPAEALKKELERRFAPARLMPGKGQWTGLERMRLKDKPQEQASIFFSGDRAPFRRAGAFELRKGILISYAELRGPLAKQAAEL